MYIKLECPSCRTRIRFEKNVLILSDIKCISCKTVVCDILEVKESAPVEPNTFSIKEGDTLLKAMSKGTWKFKDTYDIKEWDKSLNCGKLGCIWSIDTDEYSRHFTLEDGKDLVWLRNNAETLLKMAIKYINVSIFLKNELCTSCPHSYRDFLLSTLNKIS